MTKVPLRGQKSVRNQSETGQTQPLSLPCLFPQPLTRTFTPTPIPISTTTTATATASAAGTTVSFPDRFRTAQAYFAPKFEIETIHAWIFTLITRLATTLSTTTTPAATAPPLPLVHLGISAFTRVPLKGQKPVRNPSETGQTQPSVPLPPSLPPSLSLSLFPSLSLSSLALLLELLSYSYSYSYFDSYSYPYYYYYSSYYYYSYSYSSYWYYCEFSGPRNFLFFSNMKTNAFMGGSFY